MLSEESKQVKRKVIFLTGTRADFGKMKPLMIGVAATEDFLVEIFVTGMHMLARFGSTWEEVSRSKIGQIYPFVNQSPGDTMPAILGKTIVGFTDYVNERRPDLIVVHGDRIEALAGAAVGALTNTRVAHIEGGEISGTIDEVLRHAISKLSHSHFVSNIESKERLVQLGESRKAVFVIGSPDIDVMDSDVLPDHAESMSHYGLEQRPYCILILHPVTTEIDTVRNQTENVMSVLEKGDYEVIVIEPNNDLGSEVIRDVYETYSQNDKFHFFPSMRFEYFLTILKQALFVIGNSSVGIREAPHYGIPALNVGNRQLNRVNSALVLNVGVDPMEIGSVINQAMQLERVPEKNFGDGKSVFRFLKILQEEDVWDRSLQKQFIDLPKNGKG